MAKTAYELLNEGIVLAKKQDLPAGQKALFVSLVFVHMTAEIVEALSRCGTDEDRAQLKADVLKVVHEHVTPLDIPGLPNIIEPYIDNALETGVGAGLDVAFAKLSEIKVEIDKILASK